MILRVMSDDSNNDVDNSGSDSDEDDNEEDASDGYKYNHSYLGFKNSKARSVESVEENVPHNIRCLCPGHPQTGAEPLVTGAVHHGADPPVC